MVFRNATPTKTAYLPPAEIVERFSQYVVLEQYCIVNIDTSKEVNTTLHFCPINRDMEGGGKQSRLLARILSKLRGDSHRYFNKSVSSHTFDLITKSIGCHINMNEDTCSNATATANIVPPTASTSSGDDELITSSVDLRYSGQYFTAEQLPEFCDQLHNLVEVIRNIQEYAHITGEYPSELERRLETEAREVASLAAEVRNACDAISRTRAQRQAVATQRNNLMEHLTAVKETETRELENTVRLSDRKLFKHWESVKNSKDPSAFNSLLEEIRIKKSALECLVRLVDNRKAALARSTPPPRPPLPPPAPRDSSEEPSSGETRAERTETRRGTKRRYKEASREARSVPLSGEPSRHDPVSHVTLYIEGTECASRQRVSSAGAITITPMELPSHGSVRDIVFFTTN